MDNPLDKIELIHSLINNDCRKALVKIEEFEKEYPYDNLFLFYKGGFLIDIGHNLKDCELIKNGIVEAEKSLSLVKGKTEKAYLHYCLANGHLGLFELEENKGADGYKIIPKSENLYKAKQHLRLSISKGEFDNSDLKGQIYVNLGNCLDTLGRGVEAIDLYDKAISVNNKFSMAIANRAMALRAFAEISDKYRVPIYIEAYQDIQSVINNSDLVTIGGGDAKGRFEHELQYIESLFQGKSLLKKKLKHPKYETSHLSNFEKFYLDFCQKEKLFLNLHIHQDHCETAIEDSIFISLITKMDDNDTFYKFAKYLNQIKEDYAVARLLLVQSQYKQVDFNRISKRTTYVNSLDYSQFNIYNGLLKSSFKEAFNVLDKIAVFINDYYPLGFNEEDIYFEVIRHTGGNSIWQDAGTIRKEILNSENLSLYALYDIYRDFLSGENRRVKDIRNALTHRRLVIYDSELTDWDNKLDKHNIGYNTMLRETIQLMKLVKASIMYLVNFVNVEESKKKRANDKPILDMYVDTSQFL
jgi:hypothetical protein